jgi:hypothetical protein
MAQKADKRIPLASATVDTGDQHFLARRVDGIAGHNEARYPIDRIFDVTRALLAGN